MWDEELRETAGELLQLELESYCFISAIHKHSSCIEASMHLMLVNFTEIIIISSEEPPFL